MSDRRYWIGVASRDHVMKGVVGGFCQLGHGKAAPVKRLSPGGVMHLTKVIDSPLLAAVPSTDLGTGAPGITNEMIESGVDAFFESCSDRVDFTGSLTAREMVRRIISAALPYRNVDTRS